MDRFHTKLSSGKHSNRGPGEDSSTPQTSQLPLTPAQREICIGQQLNPASPLYNMGMLYHIKGDFDPAKFIGAWDATVACADALRIRLLLSNGEATQYIENNTVPTTVLDFTGKQDPLTDARAWIQTNIEKPVPLTGALVESTLVKLSASEWFWYCKQHHIITDATSYAAIWHQICSFYANDISDANTIIKNSFLSYAKNLVECITDGKDKQTNAKTNRIIDYWKNRQLPPSPGLYGRKPTFTSTLALRDEQFFSPSKAADLESILQLPDIRSFSPHLARFQVLLTVFFTYLYRVSGQATLVIATTAPNRSDAKFTTTPGLFVELLPLTVTIEKNETFSTLHTKIKAEVMAFFKNAQPGAGSAIASRDISAVLNYVPLTMEALDGMSVNTEWLHAGHMDRQHAIRLHAMDWNNAGNISLAFDTNDSCFSPEQKKSARQHWLSLFDAFIDNRNQPIDHIDILINDPYNNSITSRPPDNPNGQISTNIIEQFDRTTQKHAQEVAIVQGGKNITYAELSAVVDNNSRHILGLTGGTGHHIAILLPRSLSVPIALLSILKAGATYIPIEVKNPLARIKHLLKNAEAQIVITTADLAAKLKSSLTTIVLNDNGAITDTTEHVSDNKKHRQPIRTSDQNTPAYVLYTSGSTGTPKGVVISRQSLMNYCNWAIDFYTGGRQLAFPFFTPFGFDLTVTSILVPLLSGGRIHVYNSSMNGVDNSILDVIKDNKVDIIKLTPAHLAMLQQHNLSHCRAAQLIVGGEDLKCSLAQKIHNAFEGKVTIHNEYGPTEASVGCIVHTFDAQKDLTGSVPIGLPVAGMSATLLNNALQPQAAGVAGTLYLSGPSLANGYWNNQQQTDNAFITLKGEKSLRSYCTGDLARLNESGQLVYLGRDDDQRKIRGARVELAEIESAALQKTTATNCVVKTIHAGVPDVKSAELFCMRCGLSSLYPEATINKDGICSLCIEFEHYKEKAGVYFKTNRELQLVSENLKTQDQSKYDCMMLLSGGKDSTYALAQLVDKGLKVLAYTLDNGYLSTEAKANIKQVCLALGVDHEFGETPAMRKIFAESLEQFSNVCNGCFKTIYTLSMQRARDLKIPAIFTGLSRGQFFETRLTRELFQDPEINNDIIDSTVMSARKAYHRTNDAISQLLDTAHFQNDDIFDNVKIFDFYRYCDVDLDEMLDYLENRLPWIRPTDTGRSTNCLINDVGIYIHQKERGFHNYSLPYSWDVRLGHKKRDAALEELDDEINIEQVEKILSEIGYAPQNTATSTEARLALYYTANGPVSASNMEQQLRTELPDWMIPDWFVQLDELPLNNNGKIDKSALPDPHGQRNIDTVEYVQATTDIEKTLAKIWCEQLKLDKVGIHDNFFELGGDSLSAIRIAAKMSQNGLNFNNAELFERQTIAELAQGCCTTTDQPVQNPVSNPETPKPFASLDASQLEKLAKVIGKPDKPAT